MATARPKRDAAASRRQRPRLIHGMYAPPKLQLGNVRKWNRQRKWGIPNAWFEGLGPAPEWPTDSTLACVTLEVALPGKDGVPGHVRTVNELWDIVLTQHPRAEKWPELRIDAEHLELLEGATYEPGIRWRILDLGANWDKEVGIRPVDVRNPRTSPNVDGFAALAHCPRYVRSMDGITIPYLWVPGFMVSVPGDGPRWGVPLVGFDIDDRPVSLGVSYGGGRVPDFAVPVRREWKRAA